MSSNIKHIDLKSVLRKVRNYEIRLRKVISGSVAGEIKSLTKGSGLEFDDVRPYQWGDDVRVIDWNVTAKGQGTYIKTFKEEKDQTVWVLLDISGSTEVIGKQELIKELSGLLYLSATNQSSNVGVIAFSDKIEFLSKPSKSKGKAIGGVTKILKYQSENKKTSISRVITKLLSLEKKKSLVFIISDFEDKKYIDSVKQMARKNEVILINVQGQKDELSLPLGIMPMRSSESTKSFVSLNSLFSIFNKKERGIDKRAEELNQLNKIKKIDLFNVTVGEDYVDDLGIFFKTRIRK